MKKVVIALLGALLSTSAFANLIRTSNLDQYCEKPSPRQTYVLLDQSVIATNDHQWYIDLRTNLTNSFLPSERIKVALIKPENGEIDEIYSACYPDLTQEELQSIGTGGFFSASPAKQLADDQRMFVRQFEGALAQAMQTSGVASRPDHSSSQPNKDLARSFYYASNGFSLADGPIRAIIYTDGLQNTDSSPLSKLNNKESALKQGLQTAKSLQSNMQNATFYMYGIGSTKSDVMTNVQLNTFWEQFFVNSHGHLFSHSEQLPAMNNAVNAVLPIERSYAGVVLLNNQRYTTNLRTSFPAGQTSGPVNYAFLSIGRDQYRLSGNYFCEQPKQANCQLSLKVATKSSDSIFEIGDDVELSDKNDKLLGFIGSKDDSVTLEDGSLYQFKMSFKKDSFLRY